MRANAEDQASGRGRDSVRISSKDEWADVSTVHTEDHSDPGVIFTSHGQDLT